MRLKVHLIAKGKYWQAGTEIPDEEVPEFATKYAGEAYAETLQKQREEADGVKPKLVKLKPRLVSKDRQSFVKRNGRYVPASKTQLIEGETLYWHRKREFGIDERFIAFAKVRSEE